MHRHHLPIDTLSVYGLIFTVHTRLMLSVQSPGCAGMERLGTPGGPGGGGGADHQRPCLELNDLRSRMAIQREVNLLMELHARSRAVHNSEALNLPHRIALPDGERGPDRHLQLRVGYQQSELTRSAIQPPPNKSVQDVPDWAPPPQYRKPASPHKKDNLVQKAVKYLVKFGSGKGAETTTTAHAGTVTAPETGGVTGAGGGGGTGGAEVNRQAPCVMVPLRPPPAPAPPPPAPPAPPSPPHAPPS